MADGSDLYPFFDQLVVDDPRGALRYAGHLAQMIIGDVPGNVRYQLTDARIDGNPEALEAAQQRNADLRTKFMALTTSYLKEHVIIGNSASHADARYIGDVLYEERNWS